jgi:hypothetical protein
VEHPLRTAFATAVWITIGFAASGAPEARAEGSREGRGHLVLSVIGDARVARGSRPLAVGDRLTAGASLSVARGAHLQLLSTNGRSAAALRGPAAASLMERGLAVSLDPGGAVRLSCSGPCVLEADGWTVTLERAGTVLLDGEHVHVLEGAARLRAPSPEQLDLAGRLVRILRSVPTGEPGAAGEGVSVGAGERAALGIDGTARLERGGPSPEALLDLARLAPPVRPRVESRRMDPEAVRRAVRFTSEERQIRRETASCGCTESGGTGLGTSSSTSPSPNPLEGRETRTTVKVTGLPKRTK